MEREELDLVLVEYKALRDEIVKRIELRQHVIIAAVTIAGVLLSIGVRWQNTMVVMMYPSIATLLAIAWVHHDKAIGAMGKFILKRVEDRLGHDGWQSKKQEDREAGKRRFAPMAHCGIIALTQAMAIAIGFFIFEQPETPEQPAFSKISEKLFYPLVALACFFQCFRAYIAYCGDLKFGHLLKNAQVHPSHSAASNKTNPVCF